MKTVIVYSTQTGFTKKYAEWLQKELEADIISINEAKKNKTDIFDAADAIVFGSWVMGGKVTEIEWFTKNAPFWKGKKLAVYCVGAGDADAADVKAILDGVSSQEQKEYVRSFYCRGGINYGNMGLPSKIILKGMSKMLLGKRNASESEREQGELLSHDSDYTDRVYILPIIRFIKG